MRSVALVAVLLLSAALPTAAQSANGAATGFIGSAGIGGGPLGLAGQLSVGAATSRGRFLVRAAGVTNVDLNISGSRGIQDSSYDVAVLYGRRLPLWRRTWLQLAAGPALVRTFGRWYLGECPAPCAEGSGDATAAGLAGAWAVGWRRLALGLFGNLNRHRSFWGLTLDVHIGAAR